MVKASRYEAYQEGGKPPILDVLGVKTTINPTDVTISYEKGDRHDTDSYYVSKLEAKYEINITTSGQQKQIVITPPTFITAIKAKNAIGIEIPFMLPVSKAEADIKTINALLDPIIYFVKLIEGEFNVKYNDESVYASFTRMMGSYNYSEEEETHSKFDIKKDRIFALKRQDNTTIPLKVTVYPYRNDSKVEYKFEYSYSISSKKGNSYSQAEINGLIAKIVKVAND